MRRPSFLSFIVPTLKSRENIAPLPRRSENSFPSSSRDTRWKSSSNIESRPTKAFVTSLSSTTSKDDLDNRINLGKIFNSEREYLFTTKNNIREFHWTEEEAEDLFESISEIDDDTKTNALELNTIVITKKDVIVEGKRDVNGRKIGKKSNVYDVHDGQQRLVTLSLLLAAIRDELIENYEDSFETAKEVSAMIYPIKSRLDPVCRIELRGTGNKVLHDILSRTDPNTGLSLDEENGKCKTMKSVLPKERSWKKLGIPKTDQKLLSVYNLFRKRVGEFDEERINDLIDHISDDVYLIAWIPPDTTVARNIVMGQRKGKDTEPVDIFKGMVCFELNEVEDVQTSTFERWNQLCDDIGRDILESTCLLLAQQQQETRIKRNGEFSLFERYLRDSPYSQECNSGVYIFEIDMLPAARALHDFRTGMFRLEEADAAKMTSTEAPSFAFLRAAAIIASCKEIEMVILDFAVRYRNKRTDLNTKSEICLNLKKLEAVALWMMITKPRPKDRFQRCLRIIDNPEQLLLSNNEKKQIIDILCNHEFGKPADRKKAAAILERLNEYRFVEKGTRLIPMQIGCHIEHVLPQKHASVEEWNDVWSESDALEWKEKLGNLALLDQKSNSKIGNKSFDRKKEDLRNSPYLLTRDIAEIDRWDAAAVQTNHEKYIALIKKVFQIDPDAAIL